MLLDAGANLECRPEHLVEFARLGAAFATALLALERPRVGAAVDWRGARQGHRPHARGARPALRDPLNFIGNIEARDLFTGAADVVVCDGFTGNIALKVGEGLAEAIEEMLRQELDAELVSQIGALLMRRAFDRFRQRVDAAEHGAAPLVGVNGLALIGHGRSSARAVASGVAMAARLAEAKVSERMAARRWRLAHEAGPRLRRPPRCAEVGGL